ncbi:hypothetical protein CPB84DRAFT_1776703, partial [Gymnopilus junonius]
MLKVCTTTMFPIHATNFVHYNSMVWRTSTPEPTPNAILWTYTKDITRYTSLFSKAGTFILQLDNLIECGLNGVYSTVLHAIYFASSNFIRLQGRQISLYPFLILGMILEMTY